MYKTKMQRVLARHYEDKYPLLVASAKSQGDRSQEDQRVLQRFFAGDLDTLIQSHLRADIFVELHFKLYPALLTTDLRRVRRELRRIMSTVKASTWYGDAAYLKSANNKSEAYGNQMLMRIAKTNEGVSPALYARFRQGDEFVLYDADTESMIDRIEAAQARLGAYKLKPLGVPLAIDFGYARHSEVAETYLRLLDEGWQAERGRTGAQVFFDIALAIAKVRSDVQKVYNRAWLLLGLYREYYEHDRSRYESLLTELTRGGRFITPSEEWHRVPPDQLGDFIRKKSLELLAGKAEDHFGRVVAEVAEAIYQGKLST